MKTTVTKIFTFAAAHKLPYYKGACHNLHGHEWRVEVTLSGFTQTEGSCKGMIVDFSIIKKIVEEKIISKLDHSYLNDIFENPTAEIMVRWIFTETVIGLALEPVVLESVKLWETATSYAECKREDDKITIEQLTNHVLKAIKEDTQRGGMLFKQLKGE